MEDYQIEGQGEAIRVAIKGSAKTCGPLTGAPSVTSIERRTPSKSPTNADSLTWRVTFSETVTNVEATDFTVAGTTAGLEVTPIFGNGCLYDVTTSGGNLADLSATVTLSLDSGNDIEDTNGDALADRTPTGTNDDFYVVDNTGATVTISGVPSTSSAPFTATFAFSEAVTGFALEDITLGNATASDFTTLSAAIYTALITPSADGEVTVDVAGAVATDADGNANTEAIRASSTYANTAPTAMNSKVTTTEGTDHIFAASDFGYRDNEGDPLMSVIVTSLPASGEGDLTFDGTVLISTDLPKTITAMELGEGELVYDPPASGTAEPFASFKFKVHDGTAQSTAAADMTVDVVTQANLCAAPNLAGRRQIWTGTVTVGARAGTGGGHGYLADEGGSPVGALDDTSFTVGGNDYTIDGVYVVESLTLLLFDLSSTLTDADLNRLTLHVCDDSLLLSEAARSSGQTTHGWDTSLDWSSAARRTLYLSVANTAPSASSGRITAVEDTEYDFDPDEFGFSDADAADTLASVTITSLPDAGQLTLDSAPVAVNQVILAAELINGDLHFNAQPNEHGTGYASFTFTVSDGVVESAEATIVIDVTPVNDAPEAAGSKITTTQDTDYALRVRNFGFVDVDGDALASVTSPRCRQPAPASSNSTARRCR